MKKVKLTSTNCKVVVESVQAYLLAWVNGYKSETSFSDEVNESAFVHVVDMYMNYGKGKNCDAKSWSTPWGVLKHFAEGAMLDVSYFEVNNRLKSWGLNPERYTDEKNWETYCNLICRDGERLYNKLTKGK